MRGSSLRWLIAAVGASLAFAVLPAAALAASPPAIESESASNVTQRDATLEAQIDPQGLETTYKIELGQPPSYEFLIGCKPPEPGEASCLWLALVTHVKEGTISATAGAQSVSVDLNEASAWLEPSTTYHFRVVATSSAGTTEGPDRTFTTPPTGGAPVIESVSLSHLTPTDATLEAKINTEGQATIYLFHMWSSCAHEACEYLRAIPLPPGSLLGSFVGQSISLDLNSVGVTLKSGEEYGWGVTAASGLEHASASGEVFEPLADVVEPLEPHCHARPQRHRACNIIQ